MNRFFRSALFPLIVIVLLVYLASQTLIPRKDAQKKMQYSELIGQVEAGNVQEVVFTPNRQQINATLIGGDKIKVNYPSDESALDLEKKLQAENVTYDSKGKGGSWWSSLLISVLPFVLRRVGFDPASASAPLIATFVDVTGLIIYFNVALYLLLR